MAYHTPAPLPPNWQHGIAITDRESEPENCSCPNRSVWCPCMNFCWGVPHYFHDASTEVSTGYQPDASLWFPGWFCGWNMDNSDVMGQKMRFEGRECCGTESCCEPEVHVWDKNPDPNGEDVKLGHVVAKCYMCPCGEETMAEAFDAQGNSRFKRTENCCFPEFFYYHLEGCCWHTFRWPIKNADTNNVATYLFYKYHCCSFCHGTASGVNEFPPNSSAIDQKLLVAMAVMRWWRIGERLKKDEEGHGENQQ